LSNLNHILLDTRPHAAGYIAPPAGYIAPPAGFFHCLCSLNCRAVSAKKSTPAGYIAPPSPAGYKAPPLPPWGFFCRDATVTAFRPTIRQCFGITAIPLIKLCKYSLPISIPFFATAFAPAFAKSPKTPFPAFRHVIVRIGFLVIGAV
jgi:hypothetical protein